MTNTNARSQTKPKAKAPRPTQALNFNAGVRFVSIFTLVFFAGFWLLLQLDLTALTAPLAQLQSSLLSSAGIPNTLTQTTLYTALHEFEIVTECTGLVLVLMLGALLLATPEALCTARRKLAYFAVFTPFLIAFNALRLFLTLYLGTLAPGAFDAIHVTFWFVDSAVVFGIWAKAAKL